jgi:hypothetical protein
MDAPRGESKEVGVGEYLDVFCHSLAVSTALPQIQV